MATLQMDLMVLALACERRASPRCSGHVRCRDVRFTWLGIDEGHHELSHLPDNDAEAQDKLMRINTWYAERSRA